MHVRASKGAAHLGYWGFRDAGPDLGRNHQMNVKSLVLSAVGLLVLLKDPRTRDQRGLSQSAENAILLAGAVAVALIVIGAITTYVSGRMPK